MIYRYPFKAFLISLTLIILNGFNTAFAQAPNINYQSPQTYTQGTTINPLIPNNRGGAVPATGYGQVSITAGGASANFNHPTGVTGDASGNLYITDRDNNRIRKITPGGTITTFAGSGIAGSTDGSGAAASFNGPTGIAADVAGNIYVADSYGNKIRKITPGGVVSTLAGSGAQGANDGSATTASFGSPTGVAVDAAGNVYVADWGNNVIRKVTPAGMVSTFAGSGLPGKSDGTATTASFKNPWGITIDPSGNIYVADQGNNLVRKVTPSGMVTTIPNKWSVSDTMNGIAADAAGNVYFDYAGNGLIYRIDPGGNVTLVAGAGSGFVYLLGLYANAAGHIYVADFGGNQVGEVVNNGYTIDKTLPPGLTFDPTTGIIDGTPTAASPATNYTVTAYNAGGSSSTIVNITVKVNSIPVLAPPIISYPTPNTYTANSPIPPLGPTNTGGAVPATFFGLTESFAGNGNFGTSDGGPITANFHFPTGVTSDGAGNLYVADFGNNMIRKINSAGVTSTFAGNGNQGAVNGAANIARFDNPTGVAIDAAGNVYVADAGNNTIRMITQAGVVSTFAGNAVAGSSNGIGILASFNYPFGIAIDAAGNLYIADSGNNLIRKISPAGAVSTFAGSGLKGATNGAGNSASFNDPRGIAIDAVGNLYIADAGNNLIRMITPGGAVTTFAGNGFKGSANGANALASFNNPSGITIDAAGNIFISDTGNNLIRMITPQGFVTTLAGSGAFGGFNNVGIVASFAGPIGLTIDGSGNLFVADKFNNQIRKVVTTGYYIDKPLPEGLVFDSSTGIISGIPTTPTPATVYTITAFNEGGNSSTTVTITVIPSQIPLVSPPAITYQTPQVYPIFKTITPLSPQNGGGPVPATVYGQISSLAGSGNSGSADGTGILATMSAPAGITIDAAGNIYIISNGSLIRKITPQGVVTTLAGSPNVYGSANGTGAAARFNSPQGIAVDAAGNLYVTDSGNELIRKITPAGVVTTLAGSGAIGKADGIGTAASFNYPEGITIDAAGNLYVTDGQGNLVRKITPGGVVTTFAGSGSVGKTDGLGTAASFNNPQSIAIDAAGNLYVSDSKNNLIRKISPTGQVSTLAGSGLQGTADGTNTSASFNAPQGIFVDIAGNVYVADTGNDLIRMISPAGVVSTVAGNYAGASGNQTNINHPKGVVVDNAGNAYITEELGNIVSEVVLTGYSINKPLPSGLLFDFKTGTISGTPVVASPATDYTITAHNTGGSSSFTVSITVIQNVSTPQVITFAAITATYGDADFDPGATSTNTTIPITYTSSNPTAATIVNGKIHITGAGKSTIAASQDGNADFTAATPVTQLLTINQALLTITANNQTKAFNTPNPILTVTYNKFVYNENAEQLITQPTVSTIAVTISAPGDYAITVIGGTSNNYKIVPVDGVLTITPVIVVPNTFTPNGDGINDFWNIKALTSFPQCIVSVYSRFGSLIYQSRGYAKPWDGTYNGSQVPVGTYYYIIDTKDGQKQLSGSVTVLR